MENKFNTETLETFLKESVEDFRMYPSNRVWKSLYNSMHPAKKWPSLAVLLILISSIMFIGVSNTTNINQKSTTQQKQNLPLISNSATNNNTIKNEFNSVEPVNSFNVYAENNIEIKPEIDLGIAKVLIKNKNLFSFHQKHSANSYFKLSLNNNNSGELLNSDIEGLKKIETNINTEDYNKKVGDLVNQINDNQKNKLAFEFYATPSIGYRIYSSNNDVINDLSRYSYSSSINENPINHSTALNLEAGGNILYALSDNMRIKAGLQLNYTNYNISAYQTNSPNLTTLLMNDMVKNQPALSTRFSNISNILNSGSPINLNNNTYQVSIPVGADIKLAGNSLIEWYAGATVQPTFVAGGNAYLLSSESNNYVNEPNALRSFNINGGLETFVSYKLKDGFILNAGPQIRYQFLSTYSNKYMLNEKLYNLGVKLGITTSF